MFPPIFIIIIIIYYLHRRRSRKTSHEKVRNFSSTFYGLRNDTDYVISVSFVLSGRKLVRGKMGFII